MSKRCNYWCLFKFLSRLLSLALSLPAPVRGFWIVSDLSLGATMICITSTYECLLLPLLYVSLFVRTWFPKLGTLEGTALKHTVFKANNGIITNMQGHANVMLNH